MVVVRAYTHLENMNGDGVDESYTFTPTESGRHGFVVFKNDRSDLNGNPYALVIGNRIPESPDSLVIKWASDAPFSLELTWSPAVTDIYGQPLTVETYNLIYTYNLNAVYPVGWLNGGSTLDNTQLPIFPNAAEFGFYCVVLAVDSDGLVLGQSGPAGGVSFVGQRIDDIRAALPHRNLLTPPASESTPVSE
ncbi:MAG: hypothetical protein IPP40_07515 [bacterium]|nr:hypothetical protein [bacterium]